MFELNSLKDHVGQCSQLLHLRLHPGQVELGLELEPTHL